MLTDDSVPVSAPVKEEPPKCEKPLNVGSIKEIKLVQCKKDGPNKGRWFWSGQNANESFFMWANEVKVTPKPPEDAPAGVKYLQVKRESPNKGRFFWGGVRGNKYFRWADEDKMILTKEELPLDETKKHEPPTTPKDTPEKKAKVDSSAVSTIKFDMSAYVTKPKPSAKVEKK